MAGAGAVLTVSLARDGRDTAPSVPPLAVPENTAAGTGAPAAVTSGEPSPSGGASAAASSAPIAGPTGPSPAATRATTAAPKSLPNGRVQMKLAHTGMCVGEGPELFKSTGRTVLGQHPCASAGPPVSIAPIAGTTVRIKLDSQAFGIECATVDYGGTADGLLLAGRPCDDARADQKFTLEAAASGYRLHAVPGSGFCIGVYLASRDPGVQLIQTQCDGGADQVFQF